MYKKHLYQIVFIILLAIQIISCDKDAKESIRFEHEILEKYVLKDLQENDIKYAKDEYDNYWYSVKEREKVRKINKKNTDIISTGIEFTENSPISTKFEEGLASHNIPYKLEKFKDGRILFIFNHWEHKEAIYELYKSMNTWTE